jgi:hypothetical protein
VTGWTVLAGCGKTTLARENLRVRTCGTTENTPAGCSKRPFSKATGESNPEAYPLGYVEDFDEPRTTLADFFSILLESGQRLMTISRATLPLGPKGF